jgi:hypothetical protein
LQRGVADSLWALAAEQYPRLALRSHKRPQASTQQ